MKSLFSPVKTGLFSLALSSLGIMFWVGCNLSPSEPVGSKVTDNSRYSPTCMYGVEVDSLQIVRAVFEPNESLSDILVEYNVSSSLIHQIGQLPKDDFDVRRLRAHKPYTILHEADSAHTACSFVYHPNPIEYVALHFADSVRVERGHNPVDTVSHELSGVITSSLYEAVLEAGGTPQLVNEMADVYAWVIDFFGLQVGDAFKVLYTTYEVAGEKAGFGQIEAASFTHMGRERLAFGYDQGEGWEYFDECGASLRKTFLKAPLNFSRISSRFSYSRLHPILKIRRPHLGVDYAAPKGTPVVAIGDGVVEKAAYSGGAGRMVKVKHNSNYTTAYLHLWKYGPGIKPGVQVKQGQIIGYVGSSGLSTGPHLDFRFYQNGRPVDPLSIDPPSANPLQESLFADFERVMSAFQDRLDQVVIPEAPKVFAEAEKKSPEM